MKKVSVSLQGHRTSFSLEPEFLLLLKALARTRGLSLAQLVGQVDQARLRSPEPANLSSALRLCVLQALSQQSEPGEADTPFAQAIVQFAKTSGQDPAGYTSGDHSLSEHRLAGQEPS